MNLRPVPVSVTGRIPAESTRRRRLPGRRLVAGAAFAAATVAAGGLGSLATASGRAWNDTLDKPGWYPPDAAFGMVWTVLYVAIAIAGWLAWGAGGGRSTTIPWAVQMVLNLGWTLIFFGLQRPGWALAEISLLLAAIVWTIAAMRPVDRRAAALMVPYLAWTGFATALNLALVVLND